ncbi:MULTISPECIES: zinc ribbon domain-containing protein YjdM [Mycolicibacterium]|jgi:protein PhnA|uniref:Zinc ribbon domain-containing protein YjdM n=1 Tax=Mycolicibacterium austroafricanum TaxID=39687 RepID=A0ABT8HMT1_MYCAO|nr:MULTISPECIES: zinc ribbon domain-containing protein YjdM [Mycolicibacterium]MDN4522066.1 zinc ribbon domain-containing protein YjdM [Mycolicibacterium austroafricanum]QRZ05665.1 alkylphosphonate utilization protein [Mycolicibacterium austroafricanum]QZT67221.1 alkylphosphonate utilization protein [Mycolicibacterium austroafricanum]QZY44984.1 alkylphosphonate utilization protein [Mycolicibacterium austroafricanum]UJL28741.1 alkylphosphonate utilization protein [Mycolicibacterium vanbaalenii]
MSDQLPPCPACGEAFTYEQGALLVCPMCGHEWSADEVSDVDSAHVGAAVKDSVGNVLADGDTVIVVTTVKVKGGGGGVIKAGTKVRGIRLISDGVGDHDIDANVPGLGRMQLKSSVVKKVV